MAGKVTVIGVAGGTGSGKTTVAQRILEAVGRENIAYLPHDAYYYDLSALPFAERAKRNFDHPDSLENDLLLQHLHALRNGKRVKVPVYDFKTHTRRPETVSVGPNRLVLVEGILIFVDKRLRSLMDLKIFVDTAADIRFIRRLQRDINERGRTMSSVIEQYLTTVRPMHMEFVEPSKRYADIIIPEGGFNMAALDMVIAHLRDILSSA